ncbi:hypothetical protein PIIN_03933 [Serendipita indica DSM 11827]|uniref:Uncharacterized protein n=1 Tax=Serendipita indica (strain DSM 11827) TaxID=1109443 RepID=G4TF97_SERID|nr:hypothetical protein PIIN_03933 [Serendipita indica DSM 11827]
MLYARLYTTSLTPVCTILTEHRKHGHLRVPAVSNQPTLDLGLADARIAVENRAITNPFSARLKQRILFCMKAQAFVQRFPTLRLTVTSRAAT